MNRTLKFAMAAAIASMGIAGQAHALTSSTTSTSGSLFLYVFEDRVGNEPEANPLATNSAVFDLGLASGFNTTANNSWDLSSNSAWTTYVSTITNTANIHWGVFGTSVGVSGTGTTVLTTKSVDNAINGQNVSNFASNANKLTGIVYGAACSSCGFSEITTGDAASASWDDNGGVSSLTSVLTTGLGQSMNFYQYVSTGTKATNTPTATAFAFGGDADYFTLGSNGTLTYTAAVPEAETYAMMLAGLGLVGFMVRRRKFV